MTSLVMRFLRDDRAYLAFSTYYVLVVINHLLFGGGESIGYYYYVMIHLAMPTVCRYKLKLS